MKILNPRIALLLFCAAPAHAAVIFSDNFSTDGILNGTAPATRPGAETWTARTTAPATNVSAGVAVATTTASSYLSWTPSAGNIYSLSADIKFATTTNASNFAGIGFFDSGVTVTSAFSEVTPNSPWAFIRGGNGDSNLIGDVDFRANGSTSSPSTAQRDTNYTATVFHNLQFILNTNDTSATAGTQFSLMFLVDGLQIGNTYTYSDVQSADLLSGVNSITSVGLTGVTANNDTSFDNFILQTIPEPSVALLGALGALGLLRRSRKG